MHSLSIKCSWRLSMQQELFSGIRCYAIPGYIPKDKFMELYSAKCSGVIVLKAILEQQHLRSVELVHC